MFTCEAHPNRLSSGNPLSLQLSWCSALLFSCYIQKWCNNLLHYFPPFSSCNQSGFFYKQSSTFRCPQHHKCFNCSCKIHIRFSCSVFIFLSYCVFTVKYSYSSSPSNTLNKHFVTNGQWSPNLKNKCVAD